MVRDGLVIVVELNGYSGWLSDGLWIVIRVDAGVGIVVAS